MTTFFRSGCEAIAHAGAVGRRAPRPQTNGPARRQAANRRAPQRPASGLATCGLIAEALDPRIAAASGRFETLAIENPDVAAAVPDQVAPLESAGGLVDLGPSHSEHVRQEGLRKEKLLRQHTVAGHQQPACEASLDRVEAVARDRLPRLRQLCAGIAPQLALQWRALP